MAKSSLSFAGGYDCFISYASSDLELAEALYHRLVGAGFTVWFDKARLSPGCQWHQEIEAGCEGSRVVLAVLTPQWKVSGWTRYETYGAGAVIPLLYDGCWGDVAPPPPRGMHFVNPSAAWETPWEEVFAAIRTVLARPAPEQTQRLAQVRFQANPHFVGREEELTTIHETLHQDPSAALYRRAMAIREKALGPEHADTAAVMDNLTVLLQSSGDLSGAESLCRRCLDLPQRKLGLQHPVTLRTARLLASLVAKKGPGHTLR
jgi:hypothetical protein